ncbi:MAG: sorbitol dehydrogenase [Hyphomicrobiales bacterium]|nr:MAG: sorbitol dehydrogenase [Hyphomicrobiales bacterium]
MKRLDGKVAIITGAARGIGKAFAQAYVNEGAKVAIADIDMQKAERTASEIGENALAVHLDVTDQTSIDDTVHCVNETLGSIDILVNNAAIFDMAPIVEVSRDDFERLFLLNTQGMFFMMQTVARSMIDSGNNGKIINMASQAGRRGEALVSVYCATKAAVISFTQSAGLDLIKYGINVNAIAPGVVNGEHWDGVDALFAKYECLPIGQKRDLVAKAVPLGRMAEPEDLTGMAIFLAGSESDYVVAQTFNVDGGNWMS